MARSKTLQSSFASGELAPELAMRIDTKQYHNGAKSLLNRQILIGGGTRRRPGTWKRGDIPGGRLFDYVVNESTKYLLDFFGGGMAAYLPAGTSAGSCGGPWSNEQVREMDITSIANSIFVTHHGFLKMIKRTGAASWALSDFPFSQTRFQNTASLAPPPFAFWGDSMATHVAPFLQTELAGVGVVYDGGVGGETSTQIAARMVADTIHRGWTQIYWHGHNSPDVPTVMAAQNAMIAHQLTDRFLILLLTEQTTWAVGSTSYNDALASRDALIAAWPNNIVNVPLMLATHGNGSAGDAADIANGYTPGSLRTDGVHLTDTGRALVAAQVADEIRARGWDNFTSSVQTFYGRIHEPHYKFAPSTTRITPTENTGNITISSNEDYFTAGHQGRRLRLLDREVFINTVSGPRAVLATVIEDLRKTEMLDVVSTAGFAIDDIILGTTSGAKGIVVNIDSATKMHVILLNTGLTADIGTDLTSGTKRGTAVVTTQLGFDGTEVIMGPNAQTTATAASPPIYLGAVKEFTENLYSDATGWPACIEYHRNRLLLAGSQTLPNGIAGSSAIDPFDFDVGDASDADGFLETIGDAAAVSIGQMHSAEQLLIFTDKGPYYIPETSQNPFRPSSLAFNHFGGTWPIGFVRTQDFDAGVLMVSGSNLIKCEPTGDNQRMWKAREIALLAPHLIKSPTDICVTTNFLGDMERYAILVNNDGTLAVVMLVDQDEIKSIVPWVTDGVVTSIAALGGEVYPLVFRPNVSGSAYWLEQFDGDLVLDAVVEFATEGALAGVSSTFRTAKPHIGTDGYALGPYPFPGTLPEGPFRVGFYYDSVIETMPPVIQDSQGNRCGDLMRIGVALVHVLDAARFEANGLELAAYQIGEDITLPPALTDEPQRFTFLGRRRNPTLRISQPDPRPLTVLAVTTEVYY